MTGDTKKSNEETAPGGPENVTFTLCFCNRSGILYRDSGSRCSRRGWRCGGGAVVSLLCCTLSQPWSALFPLCQKTGGQYFQPKKCTTRSELMPISALHPSHLHIGHKNKPC